MGSKILNCKNDFPIFKNQSLAYLDTASTSQKPNSVINAVTNFYKNYNANVHRGLYPWAEQATSEYESSRFKIADFINAKNEELILPEEQLSPLILLVVPGEEKILIGKII